ncbi:MAG: endonuclease/exonuclease/phosphatase family protein [Bacteroidia bacterium]
MRWVIIIGASILVFLGLSLWVLLGTDLWVRHYDEVTPAASYVSPSATPAPPKDTLTILDWNIKFAGGRIDFFFDCYGDRVHMTKDEVETHLRGIVRQIRALSPDIVFLQEVDRNSKRSAYVDMVKYLADSTGLGYAVYASQWDVSYLPSRGIGRINSGNVILSRWPIKKAYRIPLPLAPNPWWYQLFYLRRNILVAQIELPTQQNLYVLNTHLEAYTQDDTRAKQIAIFRRWLDSLSAQGAAWIAGGDLNVIPPGSKKVKDFDDAGCKGVDPNFVMDDYTQELELLRPLYVQYPELIPLETYVLAESLYYSHTTNGRGWWNRRLDYLFTNGRWHEGKVHQGDRVTRDIFRLSDHAPITGRWVLR